MNNQIEFELKFKIGIVKELYSRGLINKQELTETIKRLKRKGAKNESNSVLQSIDRP